MDEALNARARLLAARAPGGAPARRRHPAATSRTVAAALSACAGLALITGFTVSAPASTPNRPASTQSPPAIAEVPGFAIGRGAVPGARSASEVPRPHTTTRGS